MDGWTQTLSAGWLLGIAAMAIVLILLLIVKLRVHALLTLVSVSLLTAVATGLPMDKIVNDVLLKNFGGTLGSVALLVGLGAMLGRLVETSGGAQSLADALIRMFGEKRAPFALGVASLIFGFPIFFDAGLVVMLPIVFATARRMKQDVLPYALASIGAFSVMHVFLPPHPGPIAASEFYSANIGQVLILGLPVAMFTWYVSGYLLGKVLGRTIRVPVPDLLSGGAVDNDRPQTPAKASTVVGIMLIPMLLIFMNTGLSTLISEKVVSADEHWVQVAHMIGSTPVAADFGFGGALCFGQKTRRKGKRAGENGGRCTRPRLFGHSDYRRGRHVRRRGARVGHRSGVGGQYGGFGYTRIVGLFLGGIGAAYRARFGNRRADDCCRIDGARRCRRRVQRLATRLRRFGNRGRLGRLQPLQRLGLLAGRPPFGYGRTDHAENMDGQPNADCRHRFFSVGAAVCRGLRSSENGFETL